jgi:replicative DNA helicase
MLDDLMAIYRAEMQAGRKMPEISEVLKRVDEIVNKNAKRGVLGIRTGFETLDKVYARFIPGHIWTVGGFTSVGKTATMVQMVCNALSAPEQPSIVIISTEMTEEQVVGRIVSNFTGVPSFRILAGKYHDAEEADTVEKCKARLATMPLAIYDDIYRLGEIETAFHKADLRGGVQLGVIDYVQNCRWPEAKSQYQEQSEMAKRFQALAKDVRCTLVCLSQVSNDVGRGNTDQLELKGAGEWAAVSDYGVMLSRHKTEKHRLKFDLKKNRHGALTEFELEYKNDYTKLEVK